MQNNQTKQAITALGREMGPPVLEALRSIFAQEQLLLVKAQPAIATDVAYGQHERQVLDIYASASSHAQLKPVVVFVHGGGFLKGDKGSNQDWYNSNVGRFAAREGYIGVVMNYRLAPEFMWPSGGEDVAAVVNWLKSNVAQYGGDPSQIILIGTSAGAVHVATYHQHNSEESAIKGLVLLSGLYGITPLDERDTLYYGPQADYAAKHPLSALVNTTTPLMMACSEYDPPRFQAEFVGLAQARITQQGALPACMVLSGHNHYSIASHLGTSDTRLSDEILGFISKVCA
jgi:arylformamidase